MGLKGKAAVEACGGNDVQDKGNAACCVIAVDVET
jgi:hypothetical protein